MRAETRHRLKEDKFSRATIGAAEATVHWSEEHQSKLIIGALIVAVGVLGYNLYQTKKEPEGLQINVGPSGLKIQNK